MECWLDQCVSASLFDPKDCRVSLGRNLTRNGTDLTVFSSNNYSYDKTNTQSYNAVSRHSRLLLKLMVAQLARFSLDWSIVMVK